MPNVETTCIAVDADASERPTLPAPTNLEGDEEEDDDLLDAIAEAVLGVEGTEKENGT